MKPLLYVAFATLFVAALGFTDEQKAKLEELSKQCREETGVSEDVVTKMRGGEKHLDPKVENHFNCLLKKAGILKENGLVDEELLKKRVKAGIDLDVLADQIVKACVSTPAHIKATTQCLHQKLPRFSPVE